MANRQYDDYVRNYNDAPRDERVTGLNRDWQLDEIDTLGDDEEITKLYDDEPDWDGQIDDEDEWN